MHNTPRDESLMDIRYTAHPLSAAVTLHHIHTTRFKTARLSVLTTRPADRRESPLATLLFGVMRRGSERYPRLSALNRALDELYGTTLTIHNYLHGDNHVLAFTAEMPEDVYLPAMESDEGRRCLPADLLALLSDLFFHPLTEEDGTLCRSVVEAEKAALCDSLRALVNDPRTWASNRLCELMCPDEPYGLSIGGTVETVTALTAEDLTVHRVNFLATTRFEVFYVGRTPAADIAEAWMTHFGAMSPSPVARPLSLPHPPAVAHRAVEETLPISQGKLVMGWACGETTATLQDDPRALAALYVANELFGVMQASLLFRHVREELGLCYYCESALDMTKGVLTVSAGIRSDRREAAEAAIRSRLAALQAGEIDPHDVELARLSLENGYRQMPDSRGAMEYDRLRRLLSGSPLTAEEELAAIRAVTPADVAAAARRFRPDTTFFLRGTASDDEALWEEDHLEEELL